MKIRYRLLYALPLLAVLILDVLFSTMITGRIEVDEFGQSAPSPLDGYPALFIAGCVPLSILLYKYLRGIARYVFWCALVGIAFLMAESYLHYDVLAVYPHVFQKIMVLFTLPAMYGMYSIIGRITLADLIGMIWVALVLNLSLFNPEALSMGAFVNHERGLVAASVYLLVLPLLFHFNTYLQTRKPLHLVLFFVASVAILFFQHRTVWVVSVVSLAINVVLLLGAARQHLSFKTLLPLLGIPAVLLFLTLTTLAVSNPKVLAKISENIADIENHDKQGTGGWRAEQARSYWPFIVDNPIAGMRFKGFELPIQFYDPDQPTVVVFPDGHGHFLHSFYIDALFYLGIIGLILLSIPQLYALLQLLKSPSMDPETLTWCIFIGTSLVYGYSYSLPPYFYGLAGLGFVRIKTLANLASTPLVENQASTSVISSSQSAPAVPLSV
ncbi:O-antigen ligase family protein [Hymenobacter sp. BT188]|uniref:O-antigen ligase family protein n=1 Tax=Hymenobacter sp. BT188 TaxID=2763504 RepID=UPI0016514DE5|nr:O-antigen ligase family protein [Hymenobacter sp. BT188]MBC6607472.1 O-antigen ligase family protein [Hymenobacter sp. BT188]